MSLTTLARVQAELKGTEAQKAAGTDQQILSYIRTVTDRIRGFGYFFEPLYVNRKLTPSQVNTNTWAGTLSLNADLLEPFSITVGGTSVTYGTEIIPSPDDGQSPIRTLQIADPYAGPLRTWYACGVQRLLNSIVIPGLWGMRTQYASMGFFASGVTCPAMTATQATLVVSDVAGPDIYNRTPLFSPGNLIRIDNELMEVVKVDTATKTLTVLRGSQNTTAVTHTVGTAIRIFEVEDDIVSVATRQAGLLYARRGAYMQVVSYPDGTNVSYPSDLLAELKATIQRYAYV